MKKRSAALWRCCMQQTIAADGRNDVQRTWS